MTKGNKIYWKGVEQLKNDPSFVKNAHNEFPEHLPINGSSDNSSCLLYTSPSPRD